MTFGGKRIKICWARRGYLPSAGVNERIFGWCGGLPPSPYWGKPWIYIYIYFKYVYIYLYICMYIYIYIYIYLYIYVKYVLFIGIYKRTLPADFYIQWRSSGHMTYIKCPSGHLTSARFEHFVCHRYIVCSVYVTQ